MSKTILWVEDRPENVASLLMKTKDIGYNVIRVVMPHRILQVLESQKIDAIILNTYILCIKSLKGFGKQGIPTVQGLEAGWAITENFLRTDDSKYRNIPILLLSTLSIDEKYSLLLKDISLKGGASIKCIEKGEKDWENKVLRWLDNLSD